MERDLCSPAGAPRPTRRPWRTILGGALGALTMAAGAFAAVAVVPGVGSAATSSSGSPAETATALAAPGTPAAPATPATPVAPATPAAPAAPAATTSTTTTAPPPASEAPAVRSVALTTEADSARLQQVMAIADESGWDWRSAGVVIHIAFHPEGCCHWGVYDPQDSTLWIGPTAFANPTRLRYVVLHEIAHGWQWHSGRFAQLLADLGPWGLTGTNSMEAGADCVAAVWSAQTNHYWTCPSDAQALMARRLAGDWS